MKQWLETREVLDFVARVHGAGQRAALATVVRVRGSAYRHEGAKLVLAEDGSTAGNVSGGCLEQDVREVALQVIRTGAPELRTYCSSADEVEAWDLGVGCEGQVDVLIELVRDARHRERELLDGRTPFAVCTVMPGRPGAGGRGGAARLIVTRAAVAGDLGSAELTARAADRAREALEAGASALYQIAGHGVFIDVLEPPPQLVVISAGDDARPLVRFAAEVGFRVVVVDRRPGLLTHERFPAAALLVESAGDQLAEALPLDPACYAVVMTHNFADDQAYLRALVQSPVAYIGVLGPRQRTERLVRNVREPGQPPDPRIYGPVGLDIGTDGAEQVALAVIAEILAVRSGRRARSLRERPAPIHAPAD
ncbi:MAG TPA: XdhC family protein [Gemmatimonadales bacterium]|nr:XdhC family protein [Gemmatimonadales bacterium]